MEVTQTQLLEIGLNIAGFLAGGGMLLTLASFFRRKSPSESALQNNPLAANLNKPSVSANEAVSPEIQFIDLSAGTSAPDEVESSQPKQIGRRRNRADVYQLAQQMLRKARSTEEITGKLPVSEAELDILKARNSHEEGVQDV